MLPWKYETTEETVVAIINALNALEIKGKDAENITAIKNFFRNPLNSKEINEQKPEPKLEEPKQKKK